MKRRIIEIDQDKCNGCGACAAACHEGAIAMVDGKAQLMRDDYCDGLGDCLPACPDRGDLPLWSARRPPMTKQAGTGQQAEEDAGTDEEGGCDAALRLSGQPVEKHRSTRRCAGAAVARAESLSAGCPSGRCRSSWCR